MAIGEAFPQAPEGWRLGAAVPFSSARKWSGASFDGQGAWVLGAPDVLLPNGGAALRRAQELAEAGRRVVLLARAAGELVDDVLPGGIEPVAIVVLGDRIRGAPPKPSATSPSRTSR